MTETQRENRTSLLRVFPAFAIEPVKDYHLEDMEKRKSQTSRSLFFSVLKMILLLPSGWK